MTHLLMLFDIIQKETDTDIRNELKKNDNLEYTGTSMTELFHENS